MNFFLIVLPYSVPWQKGVLSWLWLIMMKQFFLMVDFNNDHRRLIRKLTQTITVLSHDPNTMCIVSLMPVLTIYVK